MVEHLLSNQLFEKCSRISKVSFSLSSLADLAFIACMIEELITQSVNLKKIQRASFHDDFMRVVMKL